MCVRTMVLVADAVGQDGQEAVLLALLPEAEVRVPPVGQPQVDGELTRQRCQGWSKVLFHTCNQREPGGTRSVGPANRIRHMLAGGATIIRMLIINK